MQAGRRAHPSLPPSCALSWAGALVGRGRLLPGAAMGLGVSQCPLLIPRASLSPRTPREGTSFLKQWTAPTPRSQTLFPHFPEDHPKKPDTDPIPCLPPAPTFPQLLVLPLHPHPEPLSASDPPRPPAAPPALLSLHSQGTGALRRGQRGHPRYKAGETPRCSPTRDRAAGEEGGASPRKPLPCSSQRPARGRGHAWPAPRGSTGSAQPRRGVLTSVTNTAAPAKAGLPGQAEN